MTIEIVHKYTSAGDKALELQYWGLGAPGTRLTLGGARRPAEQQALAEIDQKIQSCVAEHVKQSSDTVEALSTQVAQHDSKLCEMAEQLQAAVQQAKDDMAQLVAKQTDRMHESDRVAHEAFERMTVCQLRRVVY